jgi:hypothetical protein
MASSIKELLKTLIIAAAVALSMWPAASPAAGLRPQLGFDVRGAAWVREAVEEGTSQSYPGRPDSRAFFREWSHFDRMSGAREPAPAAMLVLSFEGAHPHSPSPADLLRSLCRSAGPSGAAATGEIGPH